MIIYKYVLTLIHEQILYLPEGSKILTIMAQDDKICIWILQELTPIMKPVTFYIRGTGQDATGMNSDEIRYIGTVQLHPYFVYHVFMKEGESE